MLAIRMQRLGRKGHPTYRVVVQDVRQTPSSGKNVAMLGSYDPHSKVSTLVKEKAEFYLQNGAQPSDRVIRLFLAEGIQLPGWVKQPTEYKRSLRNPEKLRRNQPKEAKAEVKEETKEEAPADSSKAAEPETTAEASEATQDNHADKNEAGEASPPETEKAKEADKPAIANADKADNDDQPQKTKADEAGEAEEGGNSETADA